LAQAAEASVSSRNEEANTLRTELAIKNQEITDLHSEVSKLNNNFAMRGADLEHRTEQEKWTMQARFDEDRKNFLATIDVLERNLRDRSEEIGTAEDRIQELEKELSDAEALNTTLKVTMETCTAEVEMCQSDVAAHKVRAEDAENRAKNAEARALSAELDTKKADEKLAGLRAILAGYEVELEEAKNVEGKLRSERNQTLTLGTELVKLQEVVKLSEEELCQEKARVAELSKALSDARIEVAQSEESMGTHIGELRAIHDTELLQIKQEAEEKLKKVFETNKEKLNELESARATQLDRLTEMHEAEIRRLKEEQQWKEDGLKKEHRLVNFKQSR